ncbi:hypothetical protein J3R82DRAFT_5373 [Butyriboletus roseoflavus]|nr:hypothetical protein J3R82DRAFT_5373 [Butyriboletus roseoflavus]
MAPSQSGQGWQIFSVGTQSLALSISNLTGNYNITLDASYCYNENYALGVCGTSDNCQVQVPFTGSGITMYVFNAGMSGMTANFSVDGGAAVSRTIPAPPPPTYQVSNVSLYDVQGLHSGNHTVLMTMLDWSGSPTSMKFDYAYVNETLVAPPATTSSTSSMTSTSTFQGTSQTPTQTPAGNASASNQVNLGGVIGGTLGGVTIAASVVIAFFYWRKRKASQDDTSSESSFGVNPFRSEYVSSPTSPPAPSTSQGPFLAQLPDASPGVLPLQRSAILRDALASKYLSEPIQSSQPVSWSGRSSPGLQPLRRPASHHASANPHASVTASHVADASPFFDPQVTSLTADQLKVINQLRVNRVPTETVARVVEGFVSSRVPASETSSGQITPGWSILSALPPPSYQTRAH